MTVSIIITCKNFNKNLEECISKCKELNYPDFEIIVLPDKNFYFNSSNLKIVPTGSVLPAKKRDLALKYVKGDILAFLDDDAYPDRDWLLNAVRHFQQPDIAAVCGPAITPVDDHILQKAGGSVYASWLSSGQNTNRYTPKSLTYVDDFPSCNFIIRRDIFERIGGFDTSFWPGEDTILCLKIKQIKKKILYDPKVLAFHHRRPLFKEHLKQVSNYALHRGYFVKRFPENSRRFTYFIPSIFVFGLILGAILSLFNPFIRNLYMEILLFYLLCVFLFSINKDLRIIPLVFMGIILTHFAYGINFFRGLLSPRLKEEDEDYN
ncbi:MAG: glycosyltransferase [Candidatus Omnitrophica bacterium]|nr:glycosyltransferase [Candidatus Omnitrophota bacterium]